MESLGPATSARETSLMEPIFGRSSQHSRSSSLTGIHPADGNYFKPGEPALMLDENLFVRKWVNSVGPLKATRIETLITIDAIDKCGPEEPASAILSILSSYLHKISSVKFFITG